MCSHYEAPTPTRLLNDFGVTPTGPFQEQIWPTSIGAFIRSQPDESTNDNHPPIAALTGQFGLLPFWAKDRNLGRHTYNARSETVADKPSFRAAWKAGRHCVVPAAAIYEPDWRSGKAIATRITSDDGSILAIAGLWEHWMTPEGETLFSYTMLTVNADDHQLMRNFHKHQNEKRMPVILSNDAINDWLNATALQSSEFMRQYPSNRLQASAT
ncbi:TPA: SOS response-associated peptidase [Pseudomonas aeruginosa]|nr:SOS response-associated peptidase [Pseudomonas aeruginosa]